MNLEPLRELERKWRRESKRVFDRSCQTTNRFDAACDLSESEAFMTCADDLSRAIAQLDDGNLTHFRPFPTSAQDPQP